MLSAAEFPDGVQADPLPPRAPAPDQLRFVTLPPARTGISANNRYADPRMWGDRYAEFAFGSIGTGIAIADVDGDQLPDILVVGKSDPCRLYRNRGDWTFADVTDRAGLSDPNDAWKYGAAFADVDNDGWVDLYICRLGAPNLLFMNQRNGTFREEAAARGLALADGSVMGNFHDYDRDGWLDVYVQTSLLDHARRPRGERDRLFRNTGGGKFVEVTREAGLFAETQGHSATWWDYNDDGWPDLYVANDFVTPDQLYHNRGDGTFVNVLDAVVPAFPYFSMGADLGDINNDGRLDFLVADMLPRSQEQNLRGMANMQAKMAPELPPSAAGQYMRNMLYVNGGTGRFQEAAQLAGVAATDWTWSVRFEDLDEDGRVDLHVTNGMIRDFFDADFLARVAQVEPAVRQRLVQSTAELRERNLAFRNRGELSFEDVGAAWGLDHLGISFGAAFADLDRDGDLDLVFANYQGSPTVCQNTTADTNRVVIQLRGESSNRYGVGARLRLETESGVQVRELVLARGYLSTSEPAVHFGLGGDDEITRLVVRWPSGRIQVLQHLPANHRYTLAEPAVSAVDPVVPAPPQFREVARATGLGPTMAERSFDEFADQRLLPVRQQSIGPPLAVGDLDADGADDVVIGGVAGQPLQAFLRIGMQHLPGGNPVLARAPDTADAGILIFEANGDGQPDLWVSKGGINRAPADAAYQPRLLLGRGGALFEEAAAGVVPSLSTSAGPAAAADFDRDGQLDIFVGGRVVPQRYGEIPASALLHNRGGRFENVSAMAPGLAEAGLVQSALWTDVDQDGWLDLLVATHWGTVRAWRNQRGERFEETSAQWGFAAAGSGWWNSIASADFNGDGLLDYAVGNLGLNTRYQPSQAAPVVLLAGDFARNGRFQHLEAATLGERLIPLRPRDVVLAAIPALRSRFPTYASYARADVPAVLGPDRMASATRLQVTEARSGVFLREPRAGAPAFQFVALPREAQLAPIFGLVAGDFDGDARADLYGVQNSHTPHPEIHRFSGGVSQFLRGDGQGGFTAVPAVESGLLVAGEARALATTDLDDNGWPDLIVTRRDAPMLVFRNEPLRHRYAFRVRLQGPRHNPTAIGARVTVAHSGGRFQAAEVHAGGGYLSQSTADLFFGFANTDAPRELQVTWPDGRTESRPFEPGSTLIRFSASPGDQDSR